VFTNSEETVKSVLELLGKYSLWIVFLSLLLENTLFIGFIVPGVTVALLAIFLDYSGEVNFWSAVIVGVCGTILGDNLNYAIGRFGVSRLSWVKKILGNYPAVSDFFNRDSTKLYVFFHFPGYLRTIFPLLLGAARFSFRKWLWIDGAGAILFIITFMSAGWLAARVTQRTTTATKAGSYIILFFVALSLIWLATLGNKIRKHLKRRKEGRKNHLASAPV